MNPPPPANPIPDETRDAHEMYRRGASETATIHAFTTNTGDIGLSDEDIKDGEERCPSDADLDGLRRGDLLYRKGGYRESGEERCPSDADLDGLRHGDLLYRKGGYRATATYVVIEGPKGTRCECIGNDSGYGEIPITVTALIEDPVAFYEATLGPCNEVSRIIMDVVAHQEALSAAAGGRPVTTPLGLAWMAGTYIIEAPANPDLPVFGAWSDLDADTPWEYLTGATGLTVDPRMETIRAKKRQLHEVDAHAYLLGLAPGIRIGVGSPPTMDNSYWCGTEILIRVEVDPYNPLRVAAVFTARARRTEPSREFRYQPTVAIKTGPYGGVKIWASGTDSGDVQGGERSDLKILPLWELDAP